MNTWRTDPKVVIHQLSELNYKQASMIMERDFQITQLNEEIDKLKTYSDIVVIKNDDWSRPHYFSDYKTALRYARTVPVYKNVQTFTIFKNDKLLYTILARKTGMTITEDKEDDVEIPPSQPHLRSISGGRDNTGNWLLHLKEGTVFLCCKKDDKGKTEKEFLLHQFHIMKKWNMGVWLKSNFPSHERGDFFVHSLRFSQQHDLIDIQAEGDTNELRGSGEEGGD